MKYSHKLSDAVHILSYIDIFSNGEDLSSKAIAGSLESNPSLVRRLMSALSKAGLLDTQSGTVAPKLARPASEISLLDIYKAIDDDHNLLHIDEKTNIDCPVGRNIQDTLDSAYAQVQTAAENSMRDISLQSLIKDILVRESERN
ncbi:Rrf2 family transcriptional regulator [Companilactobacillus ginsenosidimutans]|uniref:Rrf2 family transcriptional regulator n=1 Tax=Companilactobacillus ginsenosidimutans TaxID=1007676 RepID=A0A0H4QL70_9LACO|nr:Rrf2 family transcriptional regulator [Companilactobacillus ginsenosidimutans]AKP67866.1 Rrf2 family transcriptional regulator [Companilactobacillus ginsenosidimutans]